MKMPKIKDPVSVVLVGIGGYGALYVDELFADMEKEYCTLVGVVDPAAEKSPKYEKITEAGIPVYASLEAFYAERSAELCCIAAPIQYHTSYSVYAMEHGSHVLCEKPLSGCYTDGIALESLSEMTGRFIMSGYQWSHSEAILKLKRDILDGIFGKPEFLETVILWPRTKSYFNRGSGWAGKCYAENGTPIFDSVASNATAHYLHNMLFINGDAMNRSAEIVCCDAELMRVNPIETFDTCAIRLHLASGADALFLASHATVETVNPAFVYQYENGEILFGEKTTNGHIIAVMKDGKRVDYGDPFADQMNKVRYAIRAVRDEAARTELPCTARTAMPHAQCIYSIRNAKIVTAEEDLTVVTPCGADGSDTLSSIRGLYAAMCEAYERGCMLSETECAEGARLREQLKPEVGIQL